MKSLCKSRPQFPYESDTTIRWDSNISNQKFYHAASVCGGMDHMDPIEHFQWMQHHAVSHSTGIIFCLELTGLHIRTLRMRSKTPHASTSHNTWTIHTPKFDMIAKDPLGSIYVLDRVGRFQSGNLMQAEMIWINTIPWQQQERLWVHVRKHTHMAIFFESSYGQFQTASRAAVAVWFSIIESRIMYTFGKHCRKRKGKVAPALATLISTNLVENCGDWWPRFGKTWMASPGGTKSWPLIPLRVWGTRPETLGERWKISWISWQVLGN